MDNLTKLKEFLEQKYEGHDFKFKGNDCRLVGLCPEHYDHNPSFNVYEYNGKAYFKCFSCGFKGSLYDFTIGELTPEEKEKHENNRKIQNALSQAFRDLKDYLFTGDTLESVFARKYLTETRLLYIDKINKCDVGLIKTNGNYDEIDELLEPLSSGKPNRLKYYSGYLVFAHTDATGNICLLRFRSPDGNKDIKTAKIKGFSGRPHAFNLQLIGKADIGKYPLTPHIYLTEGEFNSLTYISQTGNYNICSAGSKDNIKKELIDSILKLNFIPVVALDQDKAGQDRLKKLYPEIKNNKRIIYCEYNAKDFDDLLKNKSEVGITEEIVSIEHKTIDELEDEIIKEETAKKEEIAKNIDKYIVNQSLKEIYFKHNDIYKKNKTIKVVNIKDVLADETEEIFNGDFPTGISTIAGYPSAGKTFTSIYIAILYCLENPDKKAFLWLSEDSKQQIKKRLNYILARYNLEEPPNLDLCFDIALPVLTKEYGGYVKNKFYKEIQNILSNYSLSFLDPLVDFSVGIDENDNNHIAEFLRAFREIAFEKNSSIVFLHHVNKGKIDAISNPDLEYITQSEKNDRIFKIRGASAVAGSSRMVLYCEPNPYKDDERITSIIKFNAGKEGKIVYRLQLPSTSMEQSTIQISGANFEKTDKERPY